MLVENQTVNLKAYAVSKPFKFGELCDENTEPRINGNLFRCRDQNYQQNTKQFHENGVLLNNLNINRKDIVRTTENLESVEQGDKEPLG